MALKPDTDIFSSAKAVRDKLSQEQAKEIQELYKQWAEDIGKQAKKLEGKQGSAEFQSQYLTQLKKQIEAQSKQVSNKVYDGIKKNMNFVADEVVKDNVDWLSSYGFKKSGLNAAMSGIPQSSVNALLTGSVYGNGGSWSLSKAIWGDNEKNLKKIYMIIAQGQVEQLSIGEIADKLQQYVDPTKKLMWSGPNGMRIYGRKVDYASQRLARTLLQHTYQQTFVSTVKENPFIKKIKWNANGSRACEVCKARDGKIFTEDNLPLDHPNGMCVMEPVISDNMVDDLAKWVKSPDGKYPDIDKFAEKVGYKLGKSDSITLADIQKKYGNPEDKFYKSWFNKLPDEYKVAVKKHKQESKLKWDDWFELNIKQNGVKLPAKKTVASKLDSIADTLPDAKKAHKFGGSFFDEDDVHKYIAKFNALDGLDNKGPKEFYNALQQWYPDDYEALLKLQKAKKMSKSDFYKTYFWKKSSTAKQKLEALQDVFYDDYKGLLDKLSDYYDKSDIQTPSKFALKYNPNDKFTMLSSKGVLKALKNAPEDLQDDFVEFVMTYGKADGYYSKLWKSKDFDNLLSKYAYSKLSDNISGASVSLKGNSVSGLYKEQGKVFLKKHGLTFDDVLDEHIKAATKEAQEKAAKKAAEEAAKKALKEKQEKELKEKLEEKLRSALVPSKYSQKRRDDALSFASRKKADKYHRSFVDKLWDKLTEKEKYSVWEYTHNSNPINKPLSGYAKGSWERKNFVGVGNADWGTEDMWRHVNSDEFKKKFAKDAAGHVSYERVIEDLTKAIQKSKLDDDVWVVRGSDYSGLAGMIDGNTFDFDDIMSIANQDPAQLSMLKGLEVTNHAFTSTGIASDAGFGGEVKYKIFLPKGTQAIYAEPQSYFGHTVSGEEIYKTGASYSKVGSEAEVILQRGTKFRINKVTSRGGSDIEIELEVVDQPTFSTGKEQTI